MLVSRGGGVCCGNKHVSTARTLRWRVQHHSGSSIKTHLAADRNETDWRQRVSKGIITTESAEATPFPAQQGES